MIHLVPLLWRNPKFNWTMNFQVAEIAYHVMLNFSNLGSWPKKKNLIKLHRSNEPQPALSFPSVTTNLADTRWTRHNARCRGHKHKYEAITARKNTNDDSIQKPFLIYIHLSMKWVQGIQLPFLSHEPSFKSPNVWIQISIMPWARQKCIPHPNWGKKRTVLEFYVMAKIIYTL